VGAFRARGLGFLKGGDGYSDSVGALYAMGIWFDAKSAETLQFLYPLSLQFR
jgi:hypothetical protein